MSSDNDLYGTIRIHIEKIPQTAIATVIDEELRGLRSELLREAGRWYAMHDPNYRLPCGCTCPPVLRAHGQMFDPPEGGKMPRRVYIGAEPNWDGTHTCRCCNHVFKDEEVAA